MFPKKNFLSYHVALALAAGGLFSAAVAVQAEESMMLEEISVTAEKRVEKLQDVPVSVTAFSSEAIMEAGIENTQDFIDLTPNVTLDDAHTMGTTFVTIRGMTQFNYGDTPVVTVVDGVPQNDVNQFKQALFDIERIEVLRGPQGAAYGRNAIGGAINIITKRPTNEQEGYVETGVFNGNGKTMNGAVGGPLIKDTLLYRLAGSYKDTDGLIDDDFRDTEVDFYESTDLRASLLWLPTENFSADFRYEASRLDGGGIYHTAITGGGTEHSDTFINPASNTPGESERDIDSFTMKADADFDSGTLTYILGYTDMETYHFGDLDFTSNPVSTQTQDMDMDLLSHELRWTSPDEERFRWIAGGFLQETDKKTLGESITTTTIPVPMTITDNSVTDDDNTAWAVFAEAQYDLTDHLELSGSIRYDRDERHQTSSGMLTLTPYSFDKKETFDAWQPKATLSYALTDDNLVYATYGAGFRSGGFNPTGDLFEDEYLTNYEVGAKNTFLDRRLIVNAAAYFSQSDDFQYFFVDFNAPGVQGIRNIDKVDILGGELEVQAMLTEDLQLFGGLGITDTEIEKLDQYSDQEGNHTPNSNQYTLNLGARYEFNLGPMDGALNLGMERRGRKYWHLDNVESQAPITIYNARLTLERGGVQVSLWGKNLGDERYYASYNDAQSATGTNPVPNDIGSLGQPRSFGVDVRYDF